jgi:sulfur relay (sulfurtransferase) complex TusBCD TusD component (DsrE family)
MGLLNDIFGTETAESTDETDETRTYAILLNAGPDNGPTASNAFGYAIELDDAGHDVELYLDGEATKWTTAFTEDPDRPFAHKWRTIQSRGLLTGACGYCADAFDATDAARRANVSLLSDSGEHAPAVGTLATEGYELLTIG